MLVGTQCAEACSCSLFKTGINVFSADLHVSYIRQSVWGGGGREREIVFVSQSKGSFGRKRFHSRPEVKILISEKHLLLLKVSDILAEKGLKLS